MNKKQKRDKKLPITHTYMFYVWSPYGPDKAISSNWGYLDPICMEPICIWTHMDTIQPVTGTAAATVL